MIEAKSEESESIPPADLEMIVENAYRVRFDFKNPENIVMFEITYPTIEMSAGTVFFEVSGIGEDWESICVFADKYQLFSEILGGKRKSQKRVYKLRYYSDANKIKHFRMIKPDYSEDMAWFDQVDFFREIK